MGDSLDRTYFQEDISLIGLINFIFVFWPRRIWHFVGVKLYCLTCWSTDWRVQAHIFMFWVRFGFFFLSSGWTGDARFWQLYCLAWDQNQFSYTYSYFSPPLFPVIIISDIIIILTSKNLYDYLLKLLQINVCLCVSVIEEVWTNPWYGWLKIYLCTDNSK